MRHCLDTTLHCTNFFYLYHSHPKSSPDLFPIIVHLYCTILVHFYTRSLVLFRTFHSGLEFVLACQQYSTFSMSLGYSYVFLSLYPWTSCLILKPFFFSPFDGFHLLLQTNISSSSLDSLVFTGSTFRSPRLSSRS